MSFPQYPEYKDSGVVGLGAVPLHWAIKPLKAVTSHNDDVLAEIEPPDSLIEYVDISSVSLAEGIKARETMRFADAPSRARRRVKGGDVIVSTVRTYLKAIARITSQDANLIVSTGFAVLRPREDLEPNYLAYLVLAGYLADEIVARSTGVSYQR